MIVVVLLVFVVVQVGQLHLHRLDRGLVGGGGVCPGGGVGGSLGGRVAVGQVRQGPGQVREDQ